VLPGNGSKLPHFALSLFLRRKAKVDGKNGGTLAVAVGEGGPAGKRDAFAERNSNRR